MKSVCQAEGLLCHSERNDRRSHFHRRNHRIMGVPERQRCRNLCFSRRPLHTLKAKLVGPTAARSFVFSFTTRGYLVTHLHLKWSRRNAPQAGADPLGWTGTCSIKRNGAQYFAEKPTSKKHAKRRQESLNTELARRTSSTGCDRCTRRPRSNMSWSM